MNRNQLYACVFIVLGAAGLGVPSLNAQLPGALANSGPDLSQIKPVIVGVDASGTEKQVSLERGPLAVEGAETGKAMVVGTLTGGLFGSVAYNFFAPGKSSDSVAPISLKAICFHGYSQKQHGPFGTLTLVRLVEDGDKRTLRIKGEKIDSKHTKNVSERVRLEKVDDYWKMLFIRPLEAGHYAVVILPKGGTPSDYWDFDVK